MKKLDQKGFGLVTMLVFIFIFLVILVVTMIIANNLDKGRNSIDTETEIEENMFVSPEE